MENKKKSTDDKLIKMKILPIIMIMVTSLTVGFFLFKDIKAIYGIYNIIKDGKSSGLGAKNGDVKHNEDLKMDLDFQDSDNENQIKPFIHKTVNTEINGLKQVINIIETYSNTEKIRVKPALSYGKLYGFELLSEIIERHGAFIGINGGFFNEYGDPSGMVVIDGELITASTGKYPVLIIKEGKAELKEQNTKLWLKSKNSGLELDGINTIGDPGTWVLFTDRYGTTNRIKRKNITVVVKDNIISSILICAGESEIPKGGMLITYMEPDESKVFTKGASLTTDIINADDCSKEPPDVNIVAQDATSIGFIYATPDSANELLSKVLSELSFKVGDKVELLYEPELGPKDQAYECGSWIIKNGEIVIGDKDPWIGVLTNRDPRTAIGIKDDDGIIFMTVDGRQPGYSYGFTGQELGEYLLDYGVKYAAMLDGGASTEMIIDGKIINRPSFNGTERPIAGAIIIEYIDYRDHRVISRKCNALD